MEFQIRCTFYSYSPSQNPMFDYMLESSHQDDFNMMSNIGLGELRQDCRFGKCGNA